MKTSHPFLRILGGFVIFIVAFLFAGFIGRNEVPLQVSGRVNIDLAQTQLFIIFGGVVCAFLVPWMIDNWVSERIVFKSEIMRAEVNSSLIRRDMRNFLEQANQLASQLPIMIKKADGALDLALFEYTEGAFAPFWDQIERAASELARFVASTRAISSFAQRHQEAAARIATTPLPFTIEVKVFPNPSHIEERMRALIRPAQKDFHFATIYEQRKTNQLLVAGFTSLADALAGLGNDLAGSIEQLSSIVSNGFTGFDTTHKKSVEEVLSELRRSREQAERADSARDDHDRKQAEMLNNIQRHRKPPSTFGDSTS